LSRRVERRLFSGGGLVQRPRVIGGKPRAQGRRARRKDPNMTQKKSSSPARDVVTLADLAPQHDVKGGSQRRVFGADPIDPSPQNRRSDMKSSKAPATKAKDLPPKASGSVKGGKLAGNDNITLVRAVKPAAKKKDLPARKEIKGGRKTV
jgi:hypothetical protein